MLSEKSFLSNKELMFERFEKSDYFSRILHQISYL